MPPVNRNLQTVPLTAVVIALNEERRIGGCIASIRDLTDDIVVVDAHSSDRTAEIAAAHGARVFLRRWRGYSDQKNFGNAQARYDWILSLDADERVSSELGASLREAFARGPEHDVYDIAFENYFGTRRIRFGAWNPESHARLFDRRLFCWNTSAVHEGLCGPAVLRRGRLAGAMLHFTVDSRAQLAAKTESYADLFAAKLRQSGRAVGWSKVWLNPAWRFFRDYIVRLGVLDGRLGIFIAWEAARYTHLKYRAAERASSTGRLANWLALGATAAMLALVLTRSTGPGLWTPLAAPASHFTPTESAHETGSDLVVQSDDEDGNEVLEMLPEDEDDVIV